MADDDKQTQQTVLGGSDAPTEAPKPRFKTNNVNLLFRTTVADSSDSSSSEQSKTSSGAGSAHSGFGSRQASTGQKGRFTLAMKKDSASASPGPSLSGTPTRQASATPSSLPESKPTEKPSVDTTPTSDANTANEAYEDPATGTIAGSTTTAAPGSTPTTTTATSAAPATTTSATTTSASTPHDGPAPSASSASTPAPAARKPSVDFSEEELTSRGISVAGRFHSASNINWDEEEEWNPPPQAASLSASFLSSVKSGVPVKPAAPPAKPSHPTASASTAGANSGTTASTSSSDNSGSAAPWGQRKVVATNSLSDAIREAKEKGSGFKPGAVPRSARPPMAAGSDALSRFRIRSGGGGPMSFRGAPPLNPQGAGGSPFDDEPVTFQRASDRMGPGMGPGMGFDTFGRGRNAYPSDEDVFMFSRPRMPVSGVSEPRTEMPRRPIPDRLRRVSHGAAAPNSAAATSQSPPPSASPAASPTPRSALSRNGSVSKQDSEPKPEVNTLEGEKQESGPPQPPQPPQPAEETEKEAVPSAEPVVSESAASPAASTDTTSEPKVPVQVAQKKEMVSEVEMAKARVEAERAAEREKERKLQEMRDQMRQELEEKQREEEAKKRAKKEALERKHQELLARQERLKAEREAKQAAERREREEKAARLRAEAEKRRKEEEELRSKELHEKHTSSRLREQDHDAATRLRRPSSDWPASENPRSRPASVSAPLAASRDVRATYPSRLLRPKDDTERGSESQSQQQEHGVRGLPRNAVKTPGAMLKPSSRAAPSADTESADHAPRTETIVKLPKQFATRGTTTVKQLSALPQPVARNMDPQAKSTFRPAVGAKDTVIVKLPGTASAETKLKRPSLRKPQGGRKHHPTFNKKFRHPRTADTTA